MQLSATEISELIQQKIQNFDAGVEARTEGTVVSLTDGIARIHGLSDVMQGEMIEFPGNVFGMALNLERDSVGVVILVGLGRLVGVHAPARVVGVRSVGRAPRTARAEHQTEHQQMSHASSQAGGP